MEKSTGGVSFDIRFIDSGNGTEDYSAVKSQSLVGVYDGDWSLEEIEKVRGIGEREARVSISGCLGIEGKRVELDGRLLNDPVLYGGTSFLIKAIPTKLVVPDSIENNPDDNQKLEIVRLALRVGAVALHCTGLPLDELRKSPVKHFSSDEVDKFVSRFYGNVNLDSKWRGCKEIAKDLMNI